MMSHSDLCYFNAKFWNKKYPNEFSEIFQDCIYPTLMHVPDAVDKSTFLFDLFITKYSNLVICTPYEKNSEEDLSSISEIKKRIKNRSIELYYKYTLLWEMLNTDPESYKLNYKTFKETDSNSHKGLQKIEYKNSIKRENDIVTSNSYTDNMYQATDETGSTRLVQQNTGSSAQNSDSNHNTSTTSYTVNGNNYTVERTGDKDNEDIYHSETDAHGYYNSKPMVDVINDIDAYSEKLNLLGRYLEDLLPSFTLSYFK